MNLKTALDYSKELVVLEPMIADMKKTLARVDAAESSVEVTEPFSVEAQLTDALGYAALDLRQALTYLEARYAEIKAKLENSYF